MFFASGSQLNVCSPSCLTFFGFCVYGYLKRNFHSSQTVLMMFLFTGICLVDVSIFFFLLFLTEFKLKQVKSDNRPILMLGSLKMIFFSILMRLSPQVTFRVSSALILCKSSQKTSRKP